MKVVLVDDDTFLVNIYCDRLKAEGIEAVCVTEGEKVVEAAKREKPDVIVLDIAMPGRDGFTVLDDLKKDPQTRQIKVYVLTVVDARIAQGKVDLISGGTARYLDKTKVSFDDVIGMIKGKI